MLRGIIFDIDGTLLRGNRVLPGVCAALEELRRRGLPLAFLTNDSQETPRMWADRFAKLGISASPDEILTAGVLAAEVTAQRFPEGKVLPVGEEALLDALRSQGLRVLDRDAEEQADVVVMGMDPSFNQRRLHQVCRHIWGGAHFIATNDDRRRPAEEGYIPGTGPMLKAVAWATGVDPLVTGKPSSSAGLAALRRLGLPAEEAAMVGDQPLADISMGKSVGMTTVLVSSEHGSPADVSALPPAQRPDAALTHFNQLLAWLDRGDL